jgi:hypothetical protein
MKSDKPKWLNRKTVTAIFLVCEFTLIALILKDVVVANNGYWLSCAFMFAYIVGMVLVSRGSKDK